MSRIYQVTFTCDVTAESPEEAVRYAADDMTDTDLEMVWKVTDSETGKTHDVTNPEAFTE